MDVGFGKIYGCYNGFLVRLIKVKSILKITIYVGKYTSLMDAIGKEMNHLPHYQFSRDMLVQGIT